MSYIMFILSSCQIFLYTGPDISIKAEQDKGKKVVYQKVKPCTLVAFVVKIIIDFKDEDYCFAAVSRILNGFLSEVSLTPILDRARIFLDN